MFQRRSILAVLRWLPAFFWMGWIFWLSSQRALPPPPGLSYELAAIAGHFFLYAVLAIFILVGVGSWRQQNATLLATAVLIAVGYAVSDEIHQSFVPDRKASTFDLIVDTIGILFALTVWVYGWRRTATF